MAIVKATYTRKANGAKASIRYIAHRPGKDGLSISRTLFSIDGALGRWLAYRIIDTAEKGSLFYRFVISPDPQGEDSEKDLRLRDVTERTMQCLEERLQTHVSWIAAEHDDHAPHRHVHVVVIVQERLQVQDFQAMRTAATEEALEQRRHRDLALAQQAKERDREEAAWER